VSTKAEIEELANTIANGVELKKREESAIDTLEDGIRRVSGQMDFSSEAQ
jgi:hypothetical protein